MTFEKLAGLALDDELEPQLENMFPEDFVEKLADLFDVENDPEARNAFRKGIIQASDAYIDGVFSYANKPSEKQDNKSLDRITLSAQALYDALLDLMDHPDLEPRVEASIRKTGRLYKLPSGIDLSQLIGTRRNIFRGFREILVDLQVCVEDEINRKPEPGFFDDLEDLSELDEELFQYASEDILETRMRRWRERSQARKLPKNYPLTQFLLSFQPTWEAVTPHPFSEGMYYPEIRTTVSRLVDCTEAVLSRLAPGTSRQEIITAIRKARKSTLDENALS